jgi:hypothetical protein
LNKVYAKFQTNSTVSYQAVSLLVILITFAQHCNVKKLEKTGTLEHRGGNGHPKK